MTPAERATMVAFRMRQAEDTLEQGQILAAASKWPGVINRAYLRDGVAALGLLLHRGLSARKHSGVLSLVDREYVRSGMLAVEESRRLRAAFFARQSSDYDDLQPVDEERARGILADAGRFVAAVRGILPGRDGEPQESPPAGPSAR